MKTSIITKVVLFSLVSFTMPSLSAGIETRNLIIESPSFSGEGVHVLGECKIEGSAFLTKAQIHGPTTIGGCFFASHSKFNELDINASFFDENHEGVKNIVSLMESGVDVTLEDCTVEGDMIITGARNTVLTDCRIKNVTIKPKDAQKKVKNTTAPAEEMKTSNDKVIRSNVEPQIVDIRGRKSKIQGVITFEGGNGIVLVNKKLKVGKKIKITGGRVQYL